MNYTTQSELRNALLSMLQNYDLSQSLINQLLSDEFINGAFGLIQNEPENDEFMNFARNFSEEQNLSSLIATKDRISEELITEGYLTSIFQYVIDTWRDIDFSVDNSLLMTTANSGENDEITTEDVKKANIITNIVMKILEIPNSAKAVINEGFLWGKITVAVHNQDKKIWQVMDNMTEELEAVVRNINESFSTAKSHASPLVVDLDGDGIETLGTDAGVYFDHANDGFAENTGWVGKDDGLLVRDINNNGKIDDGTELFGNNSVLSSGNKATNGFDALADLDTNNFLRPMVKSTSHWLKRSILTIIKNLSIAKRFFIMVVDRILKGEIV